VAKKVLIVEDNELNLRLFQDLLRAHGAQTEGVRDARLALDKIRAYLPDLVIMDIQLPHVSGTDLIRGMRIDPALKTIPVMAVTAYAGKGDEERVRDAGADAYVSKPITVMRFVAAVEALIGPLGVAAPRAIA
jgi:two-component system cell cycle response regulator DivK